MNDPVDKLLTEIQTEYDIKNIPFEPMALWVVVKRDPEKATTEGGLEIPSRYRVALNRGTVLAVGAGMLTDFGVMRSIHPRIKPGVVVQWDGEGRDVEVQGEEYTFIPAGTIVLVEKTEKGQLCNSVQ